MNIIETLEKEQMAQLETKRRIPTFQPGDTVRVSVKVVEGSRERVQAYEGVCIGRSGRGFNESFTVRKISYGEGVERVFPALFPADRQHRCGAARQGPPGEALLSARSAWQGGPYSGAHRHPCQGAKGRVQGLQAAQRRSGRPQAHKGLWPPTRSA